MAEEEKKEKVEAKEEPTKDTPPETPKEEKTQDKKDEAKKSETSEEVDEKAKDVAKEEIVPELTNEYKLPGANENKPLNHKSFKKVLIGAAIVLLLAIVGAGALWMTHDDPVSEQESEIVYYQGSAVTAVEGEAEYNSGGEWMAVEQGTQLEEGSSLRTLSGSRAILTLDEGSAIRLDNETTITITKLTADEVVIENVKGQVYTRVVPSETRVFVVTVGEQDYQAVGTAYKTVNYEEEKGVEVYHSKVDVKEKTEVSEGETYFTTTKDEAKKEKVAKLNLEDLEGDDFLSWNKAKDEAEAEFADKLGFIKDLGKEEEKEEEEPAPAPTNPSTPIGITLSGSKGSEGINLSWSVNGVSITEGYKVVYDIKDNTPSYGENSAAYQSPEKTSTVLSVVDGNTYYIRICAYRGSGGCDSYSNTIQVTAPLKAIEAGSVTASLASPVISWTFTGTAPWGFKVVWNTSGSPTYPASGDNAGSRLVSGTSLNLDDKITAKDEYPSGTYKVRVCKYNKNLSANPNQCVDYSNEVEFEKP